MVDLLLIKVLSIAIIFSVGLFGGLAPLRFKGGAGATLAIARANAFAGGIFLGAGLLHLLPDGIGHFAAWQPDQDFPFPMLIAAAAVVAILLTDQVGGQGNGGSASTGHRRSALLLVVLSIHSVIAGASLGLEASLASSIALFIAIIAHKGAAGFALGTALVADGAAVAAHRRRIMFFACTTPVGIVLGAFLGSEIHGGSADSFEAVFDSLAAGTFFYIALTDMFTHAFADSKGRWSKLALAAIGLIVMALIAVWA